MEFSKLIDKRRSIRRFTAEAVKAEDVNAIIDAALSAPTAGNRQAFRIIAVYEKATIARVCKAAWDQESVETAQVLLVFVTDPDRSAERYAERGSTLYSLQDATIATAFAHLRTCDLGLGSVWVGAFDEEAVAEVLNIKSPQRPVAILPIGHPDDDGLPRTRRRKEEMVSLVE